MKEVYVSNYLQDQYNSYRHKVRVRSLYSAGFIAASILCLPFIPQITLVLFVTGLGILVNVSQINSVKSTFAAGIQGENRLREYLNRLLSDKYTAFYNVPTGYGDIDCLVTGPTGLYAIEVKNHKGAIGYRDGKWYQIKVGKGGTIYKGSLKNPSAQLARGIMKLKEYLVSHGISAWVQGCVVFTSPESILRVEGLNNIKAVQINELNHIFRSNISIKDEALENIEAAICKINWK